MQTVADDEGDGTQWRHGDFFPRFGETRGLYPLLLIGAPQRALLTRGPQRNTASPSQGWRMAK